MALQGLRGTGQFGTDYRPTNYRELFTFLEPNGDAPLNALLAMTQGEATDDPTYNNFRDELPDRTLQINDAAGYNSSASPITFDTGDELGFVVKGTVLVSAVTGEVALVTSDANTTTGSVAVTRNIGGTSFTISDNDKWFIAGFAGEEGGSSPTPISFDPTVAYNYTQIFKTAFKVSNTLRNTYLRTGEKEDEYATKALKLHMSDIERAMFFGRRHIVNSTTAQPTRFTGGILTTITNVINVAGPSAYNQSAGVMTEDEFDRMLIELVFAKGTKEKLAFVGAKVAGHLQAFGKNRWQPTVVTDAYGVNFTRYKTFAGDLVVHLHPQFRQVPGMDTAMVIIDFPYVRYRHLQNRDTHLERDIQSNDEDAKKHQYLTECGLELLQDKVHSYIKGWSSIAASQ